MGQGTTMAGTEQRHTRLALVDLFVLTAAFALAFSWLAVLDAAQSQRFQDEVELGYRVSDPLDGAMHFFYGTVLGLCLSGPMILVTQWLFLGRRQRLAAGEWLWLSPAICFLAGAAGGAILANASRDLAVLWVCACFVIHLSLGFFAGVVLFVDRVAPKKKDQPLPWSHTFGCMACLSVSVAVALNALYVLNAWAI